MTPGEGSRAAGRAEHLSDEEVLASARAGGMSFTGRPGLPPAPAVAGHLLRCGSCQAEVVAAGKLAAAAQAADLARVGTVVVPSFDLLLAGRLPAAHASGPKAADMSAAAPSHSPAVATAAPATDGAPTGRRRRRLPPRTAAALAAGLVWRQAVLVPRSIVALTVGGLVLAVLAARATPDPSWGEALFAAAVVLTVMVSAVCTCVWTHDPRRELMFALPVSPAAVLAARLALVLAVDLAMALAATAVLTVAGRPAALGALVSAWLGPSVLAAALAVLVAVWLSPWAGALAGTMAWLLGSVTALPRGEAAPPWRRGLAEQLWATSAVTLGAALLLLAVAVRLTANAERNLDEM